MYIFRGTKSHLTVYHILIWSFGLSCIIDWPGKRLLRGNCFEFFLSKGSFFAHAGKYQLFGEPYRLFSHSLTRISKIVLELKCALTAMLSNAISVHPPDFHQIHSETSRFERKRISLNLYISLSAQNTFSHSDPRNTSMDHAAWV